ncbi:hypothetical protein [Roseibacillus persicicus]|uniref:PEP-CTERM protein-sorting domain-containing protein n=1 Tax=Roseibacillus persicicus TaxID=454148 RepID=A0A918TLE9_9BACT|nr:hypothetical protein [Roseibacillus persicicus]MDQ8190257.1 hypothetical protein [Roseibacillus persicicus]GHC47200.1 hypothetical protein GCM10007100_11220 [Roseibacillus persicicus]
MKTIPLLLLSSGALLEAQNLVDSQTPLFNIDIIPLTSTTLEPGDIFSFEVITRLGAGGNTSLGFGNIDYSFDLGISTIAFEGVNADGSFLQGLTSTNGSISGFMVDAADADNEFIPSTSDKDFGILRADDTLDRPEAGVTTWDADWVFQIDWTVPLDATPGTYAVTGSEEVDFFTPTQQFADQGTATFPGAHTPFSVTIVPEPSVALLASLGSSFLLRRRR